MIALYLRLYRLYLRRCLSLYMTLVFEVFSFLLFPIVRGRSLQLCCLIMIERLLVTQTATAGLGALNEAGSVRLGAVEVIGAVFGVSPAGAAEAFAARPIFGKIV